MIRREKSGAVRRVETDMFHYTSSDEEWKRNVLYGLKAIYERSATSNDGAHG